MTDIVDELRYGHEAATLWHVAKEAADTIEALRAENDAMRAEYDVFHGYAEMNGKMVAEVEALRAENARLREALKPLIKASAWLGFCAQTSAGTAGRDEEMCQAIANLKTPLANARAARGEGDE